MSPRAVPELHVVIRLVGAKRNNYANYRVGTLCEIPATSEVVIVNELKAVGLRATLDDDFPKSRAGLRPSSKAHGQVHMEHLVASSDSIWT